MITALLTVLVAVPLSGLGSKSVTKPGFFKYNKTRPICI